jgi:hypothetical protein
MSSFFGTARWHAALRRWQAVPAKDRNLATALVACALIGLYGLLVWPIADERAGRLEYDLQKMAAREKRTGRAPPTAFVPPPSLSGKSLREAEREHEALKQQLERVRGEVLELERRFVPLDDSLAMNALKSGLTGLAEAGDMEVTAIEHVLLRAEDKDRPPTPQLVQEAARANPFQRPLVTMRARASFRGLMQFLDGLQALPFAAAPVGCTIVVHIERDPKTRAPVRQWLDVRIKFAV